jgi:hypothetical protein
MSTYQHNPSGNRAHEAPAHRSMSPAPITLTPDRGSLPRASTRCQLIITA